MSVHLVVKLLLYNLKQFLHHSFLQIAKENGIKFMETSAKSNINVETAFMTLAEDILKKVSGVLHYILGIPYDGLLDHTTGIIMAYKLWILS